MNIDNLLENIFPIKDEEIYDAMIFGNIEKLKTLGVVNYNETIIKGVITKTLNFTSHEGRMFTKTTSEFVNNELYRRIQELKERRSKAIEVEDYMLAANLKKEKDLLLTKNN